jgi:hypothetical protein
MFEGTNSVLTSESVHFLRFLQILQNLEFTDANYCDHRNFDLSVNQV